MPNYEEVIQQSQANIKSLSEKLKDLDKLHQDIKELIKQPEIFDTKYQQIVKLSEEYTNTLGAATKKYLDGNNTLFIANLNELSNKTSDLQKEISRLVNTDFTKLFQDLQKSFIDQTRKELAIELKKFDDKSTDLQTKIDELKKQVERLEKIDLEKHFDKLQKTLAEIFTAINAINLTLTNVVQTLTGIVQTLGSIQTTLDTNHKEAKQLLNNFSETTEKHLADIDKQATKNVELLESKIKTLSEQNELLKKEVKTNRIIQIVGFVIAISILIYLIIK
jgi:ABC-type transporter Mla subunit MlaD